MSRNLRCVSRVVLSSLLRHAFGRCVGRQREPGVARFLPHPDSWRGEIRVCKVSDGNSNVPGETLALPVDGRAACRTEVKGQPVPTFGCSLPLRSLTSEGDLLAPVARLVANHGASAALALQTMTHGDAHRFALNRKAELPAAAGRESGGHGSAPRLSISAQCNLDFRPYVLRAHAFVGDWPILLKNSPVETVKAH